ncbi:hypothetical protein SH668x_003785 [Planctomicrobium sp. SH668]|uniref:hypothetical protein n=1 Tax=Planctomicrobium sp. SH668 TaxID=3448126 RepID=UPI003F5B5E09
MSNAVLQPIAGVPANQEVEVEVFYPSIGATRGGKLIGMLMGPICRIENTALRLVALIAAGTVLSPLAVAIFGLLKLRGQCFVLTTHSVFSRPLIGGTEGYRVPLASIADTKIAIATGHAFYHIGDLTLVDSQGIDQLTITGVKNPERVQHIIEQIRLSRVATDESMSHLRQRHRA